MIELTGRIVKDPQALNGAMFAVPGETVVGELQETTVIPTTTEQTVTPERGYYGFSSVTVTPVELQEKTVTPKDVQQMVKPDTDYHGLSAVTVAAIEMQEKTVKPTTEDQTVTPDDGYTGLSSVNVSAVILQAKTVSPTTKEQTVTPDAFHHGLSSVTVEAFEIGDSLKVFVCKASGILPEVAKGTATSGFGNGLFTSQAVGTVTEST